MAQNLAFGVLGPISLRFVRFGVLGGPGRCAFWRFGVLAETTQNACHEQSSSSHPRVHVVAYLTCYLRGQSSVVPQYALMPFISEG